MDVNQILDAMEKNGYKKVRGTFFRVKEEYGYYKQHTHRDTSLRPDKESDLIGACAIGQAALNLHVSPNAIADLLDNRTIKAEYLCQHYKKYPVSVRDAVYHLNDKHGFTVAEIAQKIRAGM